MNCHIWNKNIVKQSLVLNFTATFRKHWIDLFLLIHGEISSYFLCEKSRPLNKRRGKTDKIFTFALNGFSFNESDWKITNFLFQVRNFLIFPSLCNFYPKNFLYFTWTLNGKIKGKMQLNKTDEISGRNKNYEAGISRTLWQFSLGNEN